MRHQPEEINEAIEVATALVALLEAAEAFNRAIGEVVRDHPSWIPLDVVGRVEGIARQPLFELVRQMRHVIEWNVLGQLSGPVDIDHALLGNPAVALNRYRRVLDRLVAARRRVSEGSG